MTGALPLPTIGHGPWDIEPSKLMASDLDALLLWAADREASDVVLMVDEPPICRIHGEFQRVARRRLTTPEIAELLNTIYAPNASSRLGGGEPLDFAHEVKRSRTETARFRVNATSGQTELSASGIEVVFRVISHVPPSVTDLGLEPELLAAHRSLAHSQGLGLVVGATGTGKSTVLAAMMRDTLETSTRKILTYEAPIEYVLSAVPNRRGVVMQMEIPRHIADWATGISNALRRAPNIIMVGEARDRESIAAAVQAAMTGHAVYTTLHATSVAAALPRAVEEFPAGERRALMVRLLDVVRFVMTQRLVPGRDGGRVALREFLVFDHDMRLALARGDIDALQPTVHALVEARGQSLLADARKKAHLLAPGQLELIEAEWASTEGEKA